MASVLIPRATAADSAAVQALANAKTFQVVVEQTCGEAGELALPFAQTVTELLQFAGRQEVATGEVDVVIRIHAEGRALSRDYADGDFGGELRTHFSGAEMNGWFQLVSAGRTTKPTTFSGQWDPPFNIAEAYRTPEDAPFRAPFGAFVESFTALVAEAGGPDTMRAVLQAPDSGELFYAAPQLQRCAAVELARFGAEEALPVLLEALTSLSGHRQGGAARGLLAAGDGRVLPELIAVLDTYEHELSDMERDGRWSTITAMDAAFATIENDAGFLEPWPEILRAIRDLPSPEKRELLTAALQDTESVMRRISAALLLGHTGGTNAVESLLAAAKYDPSDLVRTAAINALGALRDKRAVSFLRTAARNPHEGPDKYAAIAALYEIDPTQVPSEVTAQQEAESEDEPAAETETETESSP